MFILYFKCVLLQETETIRVFWGILFGVFGGWGFSLFSHIVKEVFFLFSPCVSSSVDTVHTRLADVFPYNLLVISIP